MKCVHCGTEIKNEKAKFCSKCGKPLQIQKEEPKPAPVAVKETSPVREASSKNGIEAIWPEWEIEQKPIGRGSFGAVYKAVRNDHNVNSYAAIKVISIPNDSSEIDSLRSEGLDMNATRTYLLGIVNDFVSEIQLMESLKGIQNIVSVEDYKVVEKSDEIGWDIYIRMELLTPFNAYICDKKLTQEEVIKLGCDICTALEICGKRNIIHRDIKPENIFINDFGYFKLGDFGIARKMENMTGGLSQKGTYNYMAPEVAVSGNYDARVDTYSLGIVLYRLLNGNRLPFLNTEKQLLNPNERRDAVDRRIRGEELPAPCDASPEMADIILRACSFDPEKRFASATEMKQALTDAANGVYVPRLAADINTDGTLKVRRPKDKEDNSSVSTRKAQLDREEVGSFDDSRKTGKLPIIIVSVLLALTLIGFGAYMIFREGGPLGDGSDTSSSAVTDSATRIQNIISEADLLADVGNYREALDMLESALNKYPDNADILNKKAEYTERMKESEAIAEIIAKAELPATNKEYEEAVEIIRGGLETYPGSKELEAKETEYLDAIQSMINKEVREIIITANGYADKNQYSTALLTIQNAITRYGEREDLNAKVAEFTAAIEQQDRDIIAKAVSDAEAYAASENYDKALQTIQTALNKYPDSNELKVKKTEYTNAKKQQESNDIASIIANAEAYAANKAYDNAISVIQSGLSKYPNSSDLKNKLSFYQSARNTLIRNDVIANAETLAVSGDYLGAMTMIDNAQKKYGSHSDYTRAYNSYKSLYEKGITDKVDALVNEKKYDDAISVLDDALKKVPGSQTLSAKKAEVEKAKSDYEEAEREKMEDVQSGTIREGVEKDIVGGGSMSSATTVLLEDFNHASFDTSGDVDWYKVTTTKNRSIYRFRLSNYSIGTSVYITLYDAKGTKLEEQSCGRGETCYLDYYLSAETTYYFKISRYYNSYTGNYAVAVYEKPCDAGVSKKTAFNQMVNKEYVKSFDTKDYAEWYKFTPTGNDSIYRIQIDNLSINTTIYITVYDEYDAELSSSSCSKGDIAYVDLWLNESKVYYIKVSRYYSNYLGNYRFSINEKICDAGVSKNTSYEIEENKEYTKKFDTTYNDWFKVTVETTGTYQFKLSSYVNTTTYITIFDEYDAELGSSSCSKDKSTYCTFRPLTNPC